MKLKVQIQKGEDSNLRRKGDPSQRDGRLRGVPRSGRKEVNLLVEKWRGEDSESPEGSRLIWPLDNAIE